jgi:hypothetical protein
MKKMNVMKAVVAIALLFTVNVNVNAQFGNLVKKAKNAVTKETVQKGQEKQAQQTQDAQVQEALSDYENNHPQVKERNNVEKAGGMDKYLGLDQTENGRILWKYAGMDQDERTKSYQIKNGFSAADQIVNVLRYLKGNTETFSHYDQSAVVLDLLNNRVPENLKRAAENKNGSSALPASDIAAIKAECARVKQLYLDRTGVKEKTADELKTEADAEYVKDIVNQNYLLNDLTDKNRQAKAVADYKTKVNAKVKSQLAPTKILGTYSTSFAWQGLPLFKYPDLNEKYNSVQEMQFKTFYEKGGKYYVVKSAFRQTIPKGDNASGAKPDNSYWPGLETPVEIPADKIQGKF